MEEVDNKSIYSSRGINTISLDVSSYANGVYLYSINNGRELQTQRMVVKN